VRRNVRRHRPKQGGLSGTDAAADDARPLGEHCRSAKGAKRCVEGAHLDEVVGGDSEIAVAADRERRPSRDRHHCKQARAIGKLEGKSRRAEVKAPLSDARTRADRAQHLDHLVVGVRDRLDAFMPPVRVTDPDDIAAVRVDVLDGGVVEEALEPVETEQCVEHGAGEFVFLVTGEHRPSRADRRAGSAIHGLHDELATECLFVARSQ
jgi:hypothetical protein